MIPSFTSPGLYALAGSARFFFSRTKIQTTNEGKRKKKKKKKKIILPFLSLLPFLLSRPFSPFPTYTFFSLNIRSPVSLAQIASSSLLSSKSSSPLPRIRLLGLEIRVPELQFEPPKLSSIRFFITIPLIRAVKRGRGI